MLLPQDVAYATGFSPAASSASTSSSLPPPEPQRNQHQQQTLSVLTPAEAAETSASSTGAIMQSNNYGQASSASGHSRQLLPSESEPSPDTSIIAHSSSPSVTISTAPTAPTAPTTTASTSTATSTHPNHSPIPLTRRAACTHIRLTRIYGPYKCHHCGRVPRLGWVYRCTQDFGDDLLGFYHRSEDTFTSTLQRRLQQETEARTQLPRISEHAEARPLPDLPRRSIEAEPLQSATARVTSTKRDDSDPELKAWMLRAIRDGHYTDGEIQTLKDQRRQVLRCLAASAYPEPADQAELQDVLIADPITMLPAPTSSYYSRRYRLQTLHPPNRPRTATIAPYWRRPSPQQAVKDERSRECASGRHPTFFGPHGSFTPSDQQLQQTELQQPSICVYQTCSYCRPVSRDRSWQCLDPSHCDLSPDNLQLPNPSIDNRLMSHPVLVQRAYHRFMNPEPIPDMMSSSIFTAGDLSDDWGDEDDDDFDLTTSGYDSSEISPDNSSEGTPTIPHFDENRGWDTGPRWMAPAPTPPSAPFRYGQPMPTPSVAYGNPLSGYGPSYPGQRRILRRASSMDPRMLRSAREMAEMADIGLVGLGVRFEQQQQQQRQQQDEEEGRKEKEGEKESSRPQTASRLPSVDPQARSTPAPISTEPEADKDDGDDTEGELMENSFENISLQNSYSHSGAISALDLRPSIDEQLSSTSSSFPAPGQLSQGPSEGLHVGGGVAVTEEAVETAEPDVVLAVEEQRAPAEIEARGMEEEATNEDEDEDETPRPETVIALFG